jgi:hypothetical protein
MNDELQQFFDQHHIEDNMFESMQAAEEFFKSQGFVIDKEAEPDYSKLSSINYFLKTTTQEQLAALSKVGKIQTTWRLKPSGD